jgi:thioredoxin reductase (NADPH)
MSGAPEVVVIGGGIAALTAALFACRLGRRTTVVSELLVGGQILDVEQIANFPGFPAPVSGAELGALLEQQAREAGADLVLEAAEAVVRRDGAYVVSTASGDLGAPAVIVATGSSLRRLGVPGEAALAGRGVSSCAACDGPLFAGRPVAVVGGGDSAADEALVVAAHASDVIVLVRDDAMSACAASLDRLLASDRVRVRTRCEPVEVLGSDGVSGLVVRDTASGERSRLDVDGVFVYVGLEPKTELVASLVERDEDGRVVTNGWMETCAPGLFAAGDIRRDAPGLLVTAAGDGATAAIAADRYLRGVR